jgi:hypothetical protein
MCRQEEEQSNWDNDGKIVRYSILLCIIKTKGLQKTDVAFSYGISFQDIIFIWYTMQECSIREA